MVLETIFSYPTWARVELLHKNTPIREREMARERERERKREGRSRKKKKREKRRRAG